MACGQTKQDEAEIATVLLRHDANTKCMYQHSVTLKEKLLKAAINESVADTKVSELHGKLHSGEVVSVLRRLLNHNPKLSVQQGSP